MLTAKVTGSESTYHMAAGPPARNPIKNTDLNPTLDVKDAAFEEKVRIKGHLTPPMKSRAQKLAEKLSS